MKKYIFLALVIGIWLEMSGMAGMEGQDRKTEENVNKKNVTFDVDVHTLSSGYNSVKLNYKNKDTWTIFPATQLPLLQKINKSDLQKLQHAINSVNQEAKLDNQNQIVYNENLELDNNKGFQNLLKSNESIQIDQNKHLDGKTVVNFRGFTNAIGKQEESVAHVNLKPGTVLDIYIGGIFEEGFNHRKAQEKVEQQQKKTEENQNIEMNGEKMQVMHVSRNWFGSFTLLGLGCLTGVAGAYFYPRISQKLSSLKWW